MTAWCQLFLKMLFFFFNLCGNPYEVVNMETCSVEEYTVFCGSERLNNLFIITELISKEAKIPKQRFGIILKNFKHT